MSRETAMNIAMAQIPQGTVTEVPQVSVENEKPKETSGSQPLESSRFANLAKKESELVKRQEEIKRKEAELEKLYSETAPIKTEYENFMKLKGENPIEALKKIGFTETDIFNFMSEQNLTPEQKAEKAAMAKIKEFEDRQLKEKEEQKRLQLEAQEKADKEAIDGFKQSINKEIANQKEKYEYINFYGATAEDLVYDTIQEIFNKEGKVAPINEVLDLVEGYYDDMAKEMSTKINKLKPKAEAIAEAKEKLTEAMKPQVNPMPKTLSSRTSSSVASTTAPRYRNEAEKKAYLVQKMKDMFKQS